MGGCENYSEFGILLYLGPGLLAAVHTQGCSCFHLEPSIFLSFVITGYDKKMHMFHDQIHSFSLLFLDVYHELKADISFLIYSRSSPLLREEQITYLLSSQEWKAGTLFVFVYLCLVSTTCAVLCLWPSACLIIDHKRPEDSLNQTLKHPSRFSLLLFYLPALISLMLWDD